MTPASVRLTACALALAMGCAPHAFAQAEIGAAASVASPVLASYGGRSRDLQAGDAVVQNQSIRTGPQSLARLAFIDDTNLTVGPSSDVKLDRFVFDPSGSIRKATVNASKGAFRFVTGQSDPRAFTLKTPYATVGIRGTVIDGFTQGGRSTIVLNQGAAQVCGRNRACVNLRPGEMAIADARGVQGPLPANPPFALNGDCYQGPGGSACGTAIALRGSPPPGAPPPFIGLPFGRPAFGGAPPARGGTVTPRTQGGTARPGLTRGR